MWMWSWTERTIQWNKNRPDFAWLCYVLDCAALTSIHILTSNRNTNGENLNRETFFSLRFSFTANTFPQSDHRFYTMSPLYMFISVCGSEAEINQRLSHTQASDFWCRCTRVCGCVGWPEDIQYLLHWLFASQFSCLACIAMLQSGTVPF